MKKKGNILLIIPCVPYPLNSGGNQAFFNMTNSMREKFNVSILLSIRPERELQDVETLKTIWPDVIFYIHKQVKSKKAQREKWFYPILSWMYKFSSHQLSKLNRGKDLVRNKSLLFDSCFRPFDTDFCKFIYETTRKSFDIIQVEFFEFLPLIYLFPPEPKKIFVHHELRYIRNANEIPLFKEETQADWLVYQVAKEQEISTLRKYDYILTLTEVDAKLLSTIIGQQSHILVSPAAILKDCTDILNKFKPATNRLTFVGSEHHFPNLDGMIWFCNEVAPFLREQNFSFTIELIGKWKAKNILPYIHDTPELKIVGFVEDLGEAMQGSISIIPIRIGSGMRMKILDTIMAPAPFVTTNKGAEGIDLRNGTDCYIADTPQAFAKYIIKLCNEIELQKEMITNAFQRLEQIYVPQQMIEKRCAIYDKLLNK